MLVLVFWVCWILMIYHKVCIRKPLYLVLSLLFVFLYLLLLVVLHLSIWFCMCLIFPWYDCLYKNFLYLCICLICLLKVIGYNILDSPYFSKLCFIDLDILKISPIICVLYALLACKIVILISANCMFAISTNLTMFCN